MASQYALEEELEDQDVNPSCEEVCSICLEKLGKKALAKRVKSCKHSFHPLCLLKWLEDKHSCPVCRHPISSLSSNLNSFPTSSFSDLLRPSMASFTGLS